MKLLLIIISFLIIPGTIKGLISALFLVIYNGSILLPISIGVTISVILYYLYIRRFHSLNIFEHELTHAIVALLFFRKIERFVSSSRGGYVQYSGGFGGEFADLLIRLAPYYLPTLTLISTLLRPIMPNSMFPYYDLFIGLTLGYHTVSTVDEFKQNFNKNLFTLVGTGKKTLSDLGKTGLIASLVIVLALTLLIHGIIFNLLSGGYVTLSNYFKLIYNSSLSFINLLSNLIFKLVRLILG